MINDLAIARFTVLAILIVITCIPVLAQSCNDLAAPNAGNKGIKPTIKGTSVRFMTPSQTGPPVTSLGEINITGGRHDY